MMSAVRQYERTYQAIRERLMTGLWPPGFQLVTPRLADELEASHSPVRESLCHLAGELMVDFLPSEGFFVPNLDAAVLRDLLDCNLRLMRAVVADDFKLAAWDDPAAADHAVRTATLFEAVAAGARNATLVQMVRGLNDRLHVFRRMEPRIVSGAEEELGALQRAFRMAMPRAVLRDLLGRYHVSRKMAADQFIRLRAG